MKKSTIKVIILFTVVLYGISSKMNAQTNLITNPGFEDSPATFTVSISSVNYLMKVQSYAATVTETTQPVATSISVTDGLWVKKQSLSSSSLNCYLSSDANKNSSPTYLFMKVSGNSGTTGIDWTKFSTQQRVALSNTKKYTLTFWAKVGTGVSTAYAFIADKTGNTAGTYGYSAIALTGGATWTKYTATFDLPAIKSINSALDYTTAYVGVGVTPGYSNNLTVNTWLYVDDFSLSESTTPVISSSTSSVTNLNPIPVTITFNNSVTGFTSSDLVITNGTVADFAGSGATYTANIIPTGEGAVTVNIPASAATDGLSNATLAATQFSRTYDITAPSVTVSSAEAATTSANPIPITITFSEAITGFDATDLVIGNGTASNFMSVSTTVYTADITPASLGQVTVDIAANAAQDAANNGNIAATQFTRTYTDQTTSVINTASNIKIYAVNSQIVIEGNNSQFVSIYSATGQLVKFFQLSSDKVLVPVTKGLYFVKLGEKSTKVLVK